MKLISFNASRSKPFGLFLSVNLPGQRCWAAFNHERYENAVVDVFDTQSDFFIAVFA